MLVIKPLEDCSITSDSKAKRCSNLFVGVAGKQQAFVDD